MKLLRRLLTIDPAARVEWLAKEVPDDAEARDRLLACGQHAMVDDG
jgi:hypothetical protein